MKPQWWMVLNPYSNGKKPNVRHDSFATAKNEASRIAKLTGKKCHVLKLVGTMYPPGEYKWEERDYELL